MCHFLIGILGQVLYLIVSIRDLCTLTYFSRKKLLCYTCDKKARELIMSQLFFLITFKFIKSTIVCITGRLFQFPSIYSQVDIFLNCEKLPFPHCGCIMCNLSFLFTPF